MSANNLLLVELDKLERLSSNCSYELKYLSKRIRKDIWLLDKNTEKLHFFLGKINQVYMMVNESVGDDLFFTLETVIAYVKHLAKYSVFYRPDIEADYFDNLINDIRLENASHLIEEQWRDIYCSENGYLSFIEIFDDIFTKSIALHKDKFFHKLNNSDVLCRVVSGWGHKADRFIPWASKTNNRWNPPGKQFLYLSFSEQTMPYSNDLSINEYICLLEYRATKGEKYSFCHFKALNEGNILDLSYNDVTLSSIKSIIGDYQDDSVKRMVDELLADPNAKEKYKDKRKLKRAIHSLQRKNPVDRAILEESFCKQYLKMICNCIYKKVDEADEIRKEIAYKSFHILSAYLESKGVTGIIYPCTRTNSIVGKNLVLFNVNDAEPNSASIREYSYL